MKYSGFSIKEIKALLTLNNNPTMEDQCIRETNNLISKKKNEILEKINNYQKIVALLDMLQPLAIAKTTTQNKLALEHQIDLIFKKISKEK